MEWQVSQLLIICPLIFIGGLVDAIGGGGGLISLPAFLIAGLPVHYAIGTNKISSAMGTSLTFTKFLLDGYVHLKLSFFGVIFALLGSSLGAKTALLISDYIFKVLMLFILPLSAFYVFKSQNLLTEEENSKPITFRTYLICILTAFFIGFYDGFYGPGAGTFMLLLLAGGAKLSIQKANGVAKSINLATNLAALAVYFMNGRVVFILGAAAGLFCIAGNYIGARFFEKGGAKTVRPVILVVLSLFFIRVVYDLFI